MEMKMHHIITLADQDDAISEIFSGYGCISSAEELIAAEAKNFADHIGQLVEMRGYLSVSGAMRWPWSQEAAIYVEHAIVV